MHGQAPAVEGRRHAIDQKRHVVIDDFNDRMGGFPAMFFQIRRENPQFCRSRKARCGKFVKRQGGTIKIFRQNARYIFRGWSFVKLADKFPGIGRRFLVKPAFNYRENIINLFRFQILCFYGHRPNPTPSDC